MSAAEIARFRKALEGMMARTDNRGYQYFAGWHGVPLGICEHHNKLFLPWHRGYLYDFELALQEIDPDVTLPWWNWMDEPGIPDAYSRARVAGKRNVLTSAPIEPLGIKRRPAWPKRTRRDPGGQVPGQPAAAPPPLRSFAEWMMSAGSYEEFWNRCARIHDNVHVWVGGNGGQMADPNWAAFDPGAVPDHETQETPLTFAKGPAFLVRDVLDVKKLGYEYAAQATTAKGSS
jgi:tyrosinase